MKRKIIDSHTHTYPDAIAARAAENLGNFYNFTVAESGTFSDLERCEREAGITGFLLLPVATSAKNVDKINEAAAHQAEAARADGFEAFAFGSMHRDCPDFRAGLEHCRKLGLRGIKLHPDLQGFDLDCVELMPLYEAMQEMKMILWLHVGDAREQINASSPERVARIAEGFPALKIVAAHFGGYREWEKAEECLIGRFGNVYYDCSSSLWDMTPERGKYLIEKCGTDRVMFGSDYPAITPAVSLAEFLRLDLTEEVRDAVLYKNFMRIVAGNPE